MGLCAISFTAIKNMISATGTQHCLSFLLVGALWGCTNPFLRTGTTDLVTDSKSAWYVRLYRTLCNWRFTIPFILNQSGPLVYYYLLGKAEISLASPICNSLTFAFTAITSWFLGESVGNSLLTLLGIVFVLAGVTVCTLSRVNMDSL